MNQEKQNRLFANFLEKKRASMHQFLRFFKYLASFAANAKYRNTVISIIMYQIKANEQAAARLDEAQLKKVSWIAGKKFYFVGGCEFTYVKDVLANAAARTYLTFDNGRSSDPVLEATDPNSPIYSFAPDYIVLSQAQQFRGLIEKMQLENLAYSHEEQLRDLGSVVGAYQTACEAILQKLPQTHIFLATYTLKYRPIFGIEEYKAYQQSFSLRELISEYESRLYRLAKKYPAVHVLDINMALLEDGTGKSAGIREDHDADGMYDHLNREGSNIVAQRFIHQIRTFEKEEIKVKCAVFDLDNTLWSGVLREDGPANVSIKYNYLRVIEFFIKRGILIAICSKNDPGDEKHLPNLLGEKLCSLIVVKKLNWEPKSANIQAIAQELNIGENSIAFFDDNIREREEVRMNAPAVRAYDAGEILAALNYPEFEPAGDITAELSSRSEKYLQQNARAKVESTYSKDKFEDYLRSCQLKAQIGLADAAMIPRVAELFQRTNQLNATLKRSSKEEILSYCSSPDYAVYTASLQDNFGDFGMIASLVVNTAGGKQWDIIEFAVSCRAMGKGIEKALINHAASKAIKAGVKEMTINFQKAERNEQFLKTLEELGFTAENKDNNSVFLVKRLRPDNIAYPDWMAVTEI